MVPMFGTRTPVDNLDSLTFRRVGRRWVASNGRTFPVVAGGADDATGEVTPIEVPDDLTGLSTDELEALDGAVIDEFDRLRDEGCTDVALLTRLADAHDRLAGERTARDEAAAQDAAAIEALANRVHAEPAVTDGDDPAAEADPAPTAENADEGAAAEPEPVMAAGPLTVRPRASAAATAARSPRPAVRPRRGDAVTIVAAADLPGVVAGSNIDVGQVARSMHDRARTLSTKSDRVPVASFRLPYAPNLRITAGMSNEAALAVIDQAADPATLDLTLLASGGWCTPSENLYELLDLEQASGLFTLPSVGVSRGGLNLPSYIGFDAADGALWSWTEDMDVAAASPIPLATAAVTSNVATVNTTGAHGLLVGQPVYMDTADPYLGGTFVVATVEDADTFTFAVTAPDRANAAIVGQVAVTKPCFKIPCPTWDEYRLAADGLCITHGNLSDRAFPELTRRYVSLAMAGHRRRMSVRHLGFIQTNTHSTAVTVTAAGSDTYGEIMSAVDLQVADFRSQYKLSDRVVLEVIMPSWTLNVIRADLAMRAGVDLLAVTDQQIAQFFAVRHVKPQFVEDYQPLWTGSADAPATAWPSTLQFLIYPAGGFVEGTGGSIDLGVQRDSRLNKDNDFTVAWTEQFLLTARRGPKARRVTVTLDTTGTTG